MTDPVDVGVRDTAARATDRTLLLEASAGTGKTTTLVQRILQLLIADGVALSEVVAVTFTEKAATEMKSRLRTYLETAARRLDGEQGERAARALRELASAQISTIHSFCGRLLRERPVEAGLDPGFVAVEEAVTRELLDEAFEEWLDAGAREAGGPVAEALRAGFSPSALRDLAGRLHEDRLALDGAALSRDALGDVRAHAADLARRATELLEAVPRVLHGDVKPQQLLALAAALERLAVLPLSDLASAATSLPRVDLARGKRAVFHAAPRERWKELNEDAAAFADRLATVFHEPLLADVASSLLDRFVPAVARRKRERAVVDFDDLLLGARDLLRTSPPAREGFRSRMQALLVDEFQDTDPVQAEVVLRLAATEPQAGTPDEPLEPVPGALFLVGDPKQSIYRFRRGDVETYRAVRDSLPPEGRLRLTTSFRTTPALIAFVNALFDRVLATSGAVPFEVEPAPLVPAPDASDGPEPPVLYLVPPPEGVEGGEDGPRVAEARAVANLVRSRLVPEGRGYRRVAVLVARNDAIDVFQEAFRAAGIPAVLEGGTSFYKREETAAVVRALRAIDAPEDAVAAVAALKSFLFGLSDRELLDAAEAGVDFAGLSGVPPGSPLAVAASLLSRLRLGRHGRPVAATLADLLDSCQALASAEAGALAFPVQALANLDRLLVEARALDAEGLSFSSAVTRLADALEEKEAEPRGFEETDDAVRLLTVHKAKGLEFDDVVIADLGFRDPARGPAQVVLYDRAGGRFGVALPFRGGAVRTPGFLALREADRARARAEEKRLLYVAMTRARKRLVVSWFRRVSSRRDGAGSDALESSLLAPIAFARDASLFPGLVETVDADIAPPRRAPEPPAPAPPEDEADLAAPDALLARARASASRPLRRAGEKGHGPAATGPEDLPANGRDDERPSSALRVGVAVHAAMERLLAPGERPPASAAEALALLPDPLQAPERAEAERLVERLLAHPVVARARAARRRFVELPVLFADAAQPGSPLVEGKIDLLFEEEDGWVIADWKTDRVLEPGPLSEREALYAPQLAAYGRALAAVLGPSARVKETLLVFARA